jgi:predicted dehydrogenase
MGFHIALIGCGMVGRVHLDALFNHPLVSAVSLCEGDKEQARILSEKYSFRLVESDYKVLLGNPDVDIVNICLPHDLHYPIAIQSFLAAKHVILEKPISLTLEEADEMMAASTKAGKRLYVALNERFLPVYQKVKEIIKSGSLGKIVMANLVVAGSELPRMNIPENWKGTFGRAGGGALADSGTHIVDLAVDWFGMPEAVQCTMGRFVVDAVNKADDTASLIMQYPDKIVNIHVTYASSGQKWSETRSVWGEKGSIHTVIESADPISYFVDQQQVPIEVKHSPDTWWADSVKSGISHAVDCLGSGNSFTVTPADARNTLQVIKYAYTAAELKRLVKMNETDLSPLIKREIRV